MIISIKNKEDAQGQTNIHITRPLSENNIKKITKMKRKIYMSKSTYQRLSQKSKESISKKNLEIVKKAGRPIEIDLKKILEIIKMHKFGISIRKISENTNIPKSTIHYLITKSKKNKIKHNGKIVFID